MPDTVICVSDKFKNNLIGSIKDLNSKQQIIDFVKNLPECESQCVVGGGKSYRRAKRKPSAYNLFIKDCVSDTSKTEPIRERFKKCVISWKELSETEKSRYVNEADGKA